MCVTVKYEVRREDELSTEEMRGIYGAGKGVINKAKKEVLRWYGYEE